MKNKITLIALLHAALFCAQPSSVIGVDTLRKSGPISKRINLVFMGDGFLANEQNQFLTQATTTSTYLLNQSPFVNYKNYFNIYAIKCVSPESGVSHPATATDVNEPQIPVLAVNNAFDTQFDNFNTHRLIYSNDNASVYSVLASWFPAYDQVVILGNSTEYGGAGGPYAVCSINAASKEIVAHEMGHSFAGLADEYWAGPVYAMERPNMTANSNTATVKWAPWVGNGGIGVYPYGNVAPENQWFHPHQNCKMEVLNAPFCAVCKQTIVEKIHSLVNPIDTYSPDDATQQQIWNPQWFKTSLIDPIPNTLRRVWTLNGNTLARNVDSLQVGGTQLTTGSNNLVFSVSDTTSLSRDANHANLHSYSVVWSLKMDITGIQDIRPELEFSVFPNPVSDRLTFRYSLLESSDLKLSVSDALGRQVKDLDGARQGAGKYEQNITVSDLPAGMYFLNILINGQIISHKFVVF